MDGNQQRCFGVWCAATLTTGAVLALVLPSTAQAISTVAAGASLRLDQAIVGLCGAVAATAASWLWLATCLVALAAARGRAAAVRGIPTPVRRLLLAACGVALTGGLGSAGLVPAGATPGIPHEQRTAGAASSALAGLPYPDRAMTALPAGATLRTAAVRDPADAEVVVAPGDSLWSLAREQLGPDAGVAEVGAYVRALHRLNRTVIGGDPDLIHPTQRLRLPRG